jgi:hypothetical protein
VRRDAQVYDAMRRFAVHSSERGILAFATLLRRDTLRAQWADEPGPLVAVFITLE